MKVLRTALAITLLLALVVLAGPERLRATFVASDPGGLALAALGYGALVVLKTERWRQVVALQGLAIARREALRAYGLGMLLAAVTPGRVGQHVRAVALTRRGATFEQALLGTVVDSLLDALVFVALLPVAAAWFGLSLGRSRGLALTAAALGAGAALAALLLLWRRFRPAAIAALALGRKALGWPLAMTVLATALYFGILAIAAAAVGLRVGGVAIALATVAAALVETAPVTVAGIGTREASLMALLGPLGAGLAAIVAFTMVVRALHIGAGALAWAAGREGEGSTARV